MESINEIVMHLAHGRVNRTGNLFQYDYGQKLVFLGVTLPMAYEVHFSNDEHGQSKTMIGDQTGVDIPDEFLLSGADIHVWVYLHESQDDGETVYHGIIGVIKRAKPTDQEPTPVQQSEIDQAISALNAGVTEVEGIAEAMPGEIQEALAEAKASGEFDGFSPVVTITEITGGHEVTVTDADGDHEFDVLDGEKGDKGDTGAKGEDGADGYSPTVGVSSITGGHRITITDANGTQTVDVMDGDKGDTGNGIASVVLNDDYTLTINYTNGQSYTTTSIRGAKGDKGNTGATGATPAFSIGTVTTGAAGSSAAATITGTAAAPVLNLTIPRGNPGDATIDDTAGAGDTTKVWSADKSSQLKSAVNYNAEGKETFASYADFVNGSLENGVYNPWYTYRVTSEHLFEFDRDLIVSVKTGYRFFLALFSNGVFTNNTSWVNGTNYKIAKGTSFKIVIAKSTEDTTSTANVHEFVNAVTFPTISNIKASALFIAGTGNYVNYNSSTKVITIPANSVLVNYNSGRSHYYLSSGLTLTHAVNSNALKLYIDTKNNTLIEADYSEWAYDINKDCAFIGCLHINGASSAFSGGFPWSIDGVPYGIQFDVDKNEKLAVVIPSGSGYVTINTTTKTISIPYDTIVLKRAESDGSEQYISLPAQTVDYSTVPSSAIIIYLDVETGTFRPTYYSIGATENEVVFCTIRHLSGYPVKVCMNGPYYIDTRPLGIIDVDKAAYNPNFRSINHRGWNSVAPENTLPAFKLSKLNGFDYVETDISFTSDNVAVLLHDNTINRTARNPDGTEISGDVSINSITYEQAEEYDFGIWKSPVYAGTKIPTFEEFVVLCKQIGLKAYVELKYASGASESNIISLVDIAKKYDMLDSMTFISFSDTLLGYIANYNDKAKLCLLCNSVSSTEITTATSLSAYISTGSATSEGIALCRAAGIRLEVWTINTTSALFDLDPYISGATSDNLVCGYELFKHYTV